MRTFEVLLILSDLFLLFLMAKKSDRQKTLIVSGLSTLILIIHFAVEGYRWQMMFPYFITGAFLIVSAYQYLKKSHGKKMPKPVTYFVSIFLALLTLISAGLSTYLPVFKMLEPIGTFEVGTKTFYYVDENRDETFTEDENDKRELMIQVWYPAQNIKDKKLSYLIPDGRELLKEIAKEANIPELLIDYLKYIKSNSYVDAEISSSSNSYPLIMLNHGLGSSRFLHISQAENLASHGYIVVAIDHTYSAMTTLFPDGKSAGFMTMEDKLDNITIGKIWVQDVKFTVDQFIKANSDTQSIFNGKIDLNNIGVFGHSFGGATAYDLCYNDNRIKAGIDLDGSLFSGSLYKSDNESMKKPFMFIFSEQPFQLYNKIIQQYIYTNEELKDMGYTREQYEKAKDDMLLQFEQFKATAKNGGNLLYIEDTSHYNYTDLQLMSPLTGFIGMTGNIDGERSAYIVNQYILDFFNKHLRRIEI